MKRITTAALFTPMAAVLGAITLFIPLVLSAQSLARDQGNSLFISLDGNLTIKSDANNGSRIICADKQQSQDELRNCRRLDALRISIPFGSQDRRTLAKLFQANYRGVNDIKEAAETNLTDQFGVGWRVGLYWLIDVSTDSTGPSPDRRDKREAIIRSDSWIEAFARSGALPDFVSFYAAAHNPHIAGYQVSAGEFASARPLTYDDFYRLQAEEKARRESILDKAGNALKNFFGSN